MRQKQKSWATINQEWNRLCALGLLLISVGCASVQSVSLTPIPAQRSSPVRVEKSKLIVLGFNFDNDYVDDMVDDLKRQCPGGKVSGILTKDEAYNYFLWMVHKRQVTAQGYCLSKAASGASAKKGRRTSSEEPQASGEASIEAPAYEGEEAL